MLWPLYYYELFAKLTANMFWWPSTETNCVHAVYFLYAQGNNSCYLGILNFACKYNHETSWLNEKCPFSKPELNKPFWHKLTEPCEHPISVRGRTKLISDMGAEARAQKLSYFDSYKYKARALQSAY